MGNIYSIYNNYKNDYNDLDEKYSKLKVANDSNKTKIYILKKNI